MTIYSSNWSEFLRPSLSKTVVHIGPNWQILKLALDVLRNGRTSVGEEIGDLTRSEQLALAADDLLRRQWAHLAPWWQPSVDAFESDPASVIGAKVKTLRKLTYEYLLAYSETGLLDADPRLHNGPVDERLPAPEPPEPELPPLENLAAGAADALHLYTFDRQNLGNDQSWGDFLEYRSPAQIRQDGVLQGLGGRLILPGGDNGRGQGTATIAMSGDWGRVADRTWEICFRLTQPGPAMILSASVGEDQQPFSYISVDNERHDGSLAIWPAGATESVSLPGFSTRTIDKMAYLTIGYRAPVEGNAADIEDTPAALEIAWAIEGIPSVSRINLPSIESNPSGGTLTIGGTGRDKFGRIFTTGSLEMLHLAVHDRLLEAKEVARRLRAAGVSPG